MNVGNSSHGDEVLDFGYVPFRSDTRVYLSQNL